VRISLARLALLAALLPEVACHSAPPEPEPVAPVPSARQLRWHELQYYAFVHFNMNTFTDVEWGGGAEDPDTFAPTELDCRQWARVAKDAGMRGLILTAKHHDGFCLWPSAYTEHSVAASSWRDGQGDVLRELSDACREYDLEFGVYLSPWDRNHPAYGDSPRYNEVFEGQLEEVLTRYGDVFEVWFDGACGEGPNGKRQVYDWPGFIGVVREHQPDAVIFSDAGPDVRWVGNERGFAGETNWGMLRRDEFFPGTPRYAELTEGHEDGTHWLPAECDTSIRPGWYYHPDQDDQVKSLDELLEIWEGSVGRGANLLLNLPVDRRGLVHENDVAALMELRRALDIIYGRNLAEDASVFASDERGGHAEFKVENILDGNPDTYWATDDDVTAASIEIVLSAPTCFNRLVVQEYLPLGQRVRAFDVQVWKRDGWHTVAEETTIGRLRILVLPVSKTHRIRINVSDARGCPLIAEVGLYLAPPAASIDTPAAQFIEELVVPLSADLPGAVIHYTLDGSEPTKDSPRYWEPIRIDRTCTVRAIARLDGKSSLRPVEATFVRVPAAPTHYMDREIAKTMSFHGGPWLLRPDREQDENTPLLMQLLALKPGQTVCDLGSGNGYHTLRMAHAVGETGRVYAVDIQEEFLAELRSRTKEAGLENIEPVLGNLVDPHLPPASVDLLLVVDVYHELSHPVEMLAAIRRVLKPGGRLAIVEFRVAENIKRLHKMTKEQLMRELTANGFVVLEELDTLPRQHLMIFGSAPLEPDEG